MQLNVSSLWFIFNPTRPSYNASEECPLMKSKAGHLGLQIGIRFSDDPEVLTRKKLDLELILGSDL